jgi:hypothetical protein
MIVATPGMGDYTNNPDGKESGFSYSFASQIQKLTKTNHIFGLQLGFESLSSKVLINGISSELMYLDGSKVSGETYLINHFFNLFPYIGKRFTLNPLDIDFTAGTDFGFCANSREQGKAEYYDSNITTNLTRNNPNLDFRLRAELIFYYKHVGISTGYSYGLTNYTPRVMGANFQEYSRLFRFGIIYKI